MMPTQNSEFQILVKAFGYLRTHWWLFLLEICVIYGISLHSYHRAQPVYRSHASILIDNSRHQMYQAYMMMGTANNNARKQNMAHLLTGQEVAERFRARMTEEFKNGAHPGSFPALFPAGVAAPLKAFREAVRLSWDRNSDIYNLECDAELPASAQTLCRAYMDTVQSYYPEIGHREATMKKDFIARQISSLTAQIAEREQTLAEIQKNDPEFVNFLLLDPDGQGRGKLQAELSAIQRKIENNRSTKRLLMHVPQAKRGEQTVHRSTIAALTAQISELQYQLRLTEASTDPDREGRLETIRRGIRELSAQLARSNDDEVRAYQNMPIASAELRKRLAQVELDYRVMQVRKQSLEVQLEHFTQQEKKFSQRRLEYERQRTDLRHRRRMLGNLYSKEQETELEVSAGNAEIFRLEEPSNTGLRVSPQLPKYVYGALSLSLFALVLTSVILIAFFPRLDNEAEVNRLNLPVIGRIPFMRSSQWGTEEVPSFTLETLKIMNYRILRETKDVKCPVVIVTSPHSREGKSTVTNLLALASEAPNRRTLLIDGDMLTARPNKFFGIAEDRTPGLRAVLQQEGFDIAKLITRTSADGISFVPRGERIETSAQPGFLKPVEKLFEQLRQEYDIIFIDTPPLFAANLAHQWAGLADLIVVVARMYLTRPRDVQEAIQTCKLYSRAPVGIALNCMPLSAAHRRASNYYFSKKKIRLNRLAA